MFIYNENKCNYNEKWYKLNEFKIKYMKFYNFYIAFTIKPCFTFI